jgi:hypothetical protein
MHWGDDFPETKYVCQLVSTAQFGNNTKSQRNWQQLGEFVRDELLKDGPFRQVRSSMLIADITRE